MAQRTIPILASENLSSVQYDDDIQELTIQFRGRGASTGAIYRYSQVPANVADGFSQAPSPGKYFRGNILNQFLAERVM